MEDERLCSYCNGPIAIRNPTGNCDHLYYPENVNKDLNKKDDGGPAFPIPIAGLNDGSIYNTLEQSYGANGGMSLRDWFAGNIASEIIRQFSIREMLDGNKTVITKIIFDLADAMLEARKNDNTKI